MPALADADLLAALSNPQTVAQLSARFGRTKQCISARLTKLEKERQVKRMAAAIVVEYTAADLWCLPKATAAQIAISRRSPLEVAWHG